jgi:subtilisin family serine protease
LLKNVEYYEMHSSLYLRFIMNKILYIALLISLLISGCGGGGSVVSNSAPTLDAVSAQTTNEDTVKTVTLVGTDADSDNLTYSATTESSNVIIGVSGAVLTLTPAANWNGAATIVAKVNDGTADSTTQSFVLTVAPVNDAPVLGIISNQTTNQGVRKTVSISSSDADGDSLTYTLTSDPVDKVTGSVTGATLTITPADTYSGTAILTLTVNDGTATDAKLFNVVVSGDPLYQYQWHLNNTSQTNFATNSGTLAKDIDVDSVIADGLTGSGVIVAVVDTGLEIAHEDLSANIVSSGSWDFVSSDTDPTNSTDTGDHGTSVSGLIAAKGWNALGGRGVAPSASLKGFNFLESQSITNNINSLGADNFSFTSSDVHIFNQSYGYSADDDFTINAIVENQYLNSVTNLRNGKGALFVKSVGNGFNFLGSKNCLLFFNKNLSCQNASMDPNNTLPYQIVVGALAATGVKSSYSTAGSAIWVSAPGGEYGTTNPAMMTTDQSGCTQGYVKSGNASSNSFNNQGTHAENTECKYTATFNGTSSAAPVLSGVIALMLEANANLTWRDVKHILATTADQVDASIVSTNITINGTSYVAEPAWLTNGAGHKFHNYYGFGGANAANAVAAAKIYTANSLGSLDVTSWEASTPNSTIPDNSATGVSDTIATTNNKTIEAVQIKVNITHPWTGELAIELTSPSGAKSVLFNALNGFGSSDDLTNMVLLSNAFYGENTAGNWTVKIIDAGTNDIGGSLNGWSIRFFGH